MNHIKLTVIFLLGTMLVAYTNCGKPFSAPSDLIFSSNVYGGGAEASYLAFEQTVYPITRSYCISCHSDIQPTHAADDVRVAHDSVISSFKVNFANIPASRMVAKLRDENHNCWGDCASNAQEMEEAVTRWHAAIKDSGTTTPAPTTMETEDSAPLAVEFSDPNNPLKSNTMRLNLEAAILTPPMVFTQQPGVPPYIGVPNNNNPQRGATQADVGLAHFNFTVPANGQYRIWGDVQGDTNTDNGFFVKVFSGNTQIGGTRTWDFTAGSLFNWRQVPGASFNLEANRTYRLELRERRDGAKLAGFIITSDEAFNGQEVNDFFGITLSFDLTPILQVPSEFLVDVIDYDAHSYKFSKPRIITSNQNIYVKGVKILVNGVFNPQHSTYTVVDKIVTPQDSALSNYSMIVLKDQGLDGDRIRISFDQLAITNNEGSTSSGNGGGGPGGQSSLEAFRSTVYPISRSSSYSCVGCHTTTSPRHASDNTLSAHDAALGVVDFNNPSNSRIVRKMREEQHNCQQSCDNLASEYENAIIEWRNRRQ